MLFQNVETLRAIEAIKAGAVVWTKTELELVLKLARLRKPPGFDIASTAAQKRYTGRQKDVITSALKTRFPNTENMPVAAINWLKLIARLDAGVYVVPPDRFLDDEKRNRIASDDPRDILWAWALKRARFHSKMAESERRALLPPGPVVGQAIWLMPPGDKIGFPWIDLYWPHDVEVLCHWQAPINFKYAFVVALRQASPDVYSKGEWWRVWSRVPPEGLDGPWGPWTSVLVSTTGEQAAVFATPEVYPGSLLPVFLLQLEDPVGYPFVFQDTDLLDVADDLNERRANESFVIGLQGHDQMWTNNISDVALQKVGPDAMYEVGPNATVGLLSPNPKLADMRDSRKLALRELAISRGNSPDAYATEPGPPLSGVAKRIANLTHDVRIAEQAMLMQLFEEGEALPILKDVVETFHPDGKILKGVSPRMVPRRQQTFEDPTLRQARLADAVDRGWITNERAAADAELYQSVEEATRALAEIALLPKPTAVPIPVPRSAPIIAPMPADVTNGVDQAADPNAQGVAPGDAGAQ